MVSFSKAAAAVCLVALFLRSEANEEITYKLTVEEVKEDGYLAVRLARNGKLPVHIKDVTKDMALVSKLTEKVEPEGSALQGAGRSDDPCDPLINSEEFKQMFHQAFDYPTDADATPNYRQALQEALTAGLALFNKQYPEDTTAWTAIWGKDAGANLGYLLGSNSTQVGCVIGRCTKVTTQKGQKTSTMGKAVGTSNPVETPTNKAVLLCLLEPLATKNTAAFDQDYFTGLIARTTKLEDMTEEDLKAPTNDSTAAAAVPTILFAGLVAMLTAISA